MTTKEIDDQETKAPEEGAENEKPDTEATEADDEQTEGTETAGESFEEKYPEMAALGYTSLDEVNEALSKRAEKPEREPEAKSKDSVVVPDEYRFVDNPASQLINEMLADGEITPEHRSSYKQIAKVFDGATRKNQEVFKRILGAAVQVTAELQKKVTLLEQGLDNAVLGTVKSKYPTLKDGDWGKVNEIKSEHGLTLDEAVVLYARRTGKQSLIGSPSAGRNGNGRVEQKPNAMKRTGGSPSGVNADPLASISKYVGQDGKIAYNSDAWKSLDKAGRNKVLDQIIRAAGK